MSNPSAFPLYFDESDHNDGMTLRDYFAAKAMLGRLANPGGRGWEIGEDAKVCYEIADEMLEARKPI